MFLCVREFIIKEEPFHTRFIALLQSGEGRWLRGDGLAGGWVQVKMGIQFGDKGQTGGERVENKEMAGKYLAHEGEKQTQ